MNGKKKCNKKNGKTSQIQYWQDVSTESSEEESDLEEKEDYYFQVLQEPNEKNDSVGICCWNQEEIKQQART